MPSRLDSSFGTGPAFFNQSGLQPRRLRVIGIGAGASGLLLAYKLKRNFELVDLTIYEKNDGKSTYALRPGRCGS